jgi:hypothetical protein
MAKLDIMDVAILAGGAYLIYHYMQTPTTTTTSTTVTPTTTTTAIAQVCMFPDGTLVSVPPGQSCPYDASHGGQSSPPGQGAIQPQTTTPTPIPSPIVTSPNAPAMTATPSTMHGGQYFFPG